MVLDKAPGEGIDSALEGQRYLLTADTGDSNNTENPSAWIGPGGALVAKKNDIIEFDGWKWNVVFDSSELTDVQ